MFSIFKRNRARDFNLSFLVTDMHSHLIPGLDDGAKTIDDAIAMIESLHKLGFKKVITTPHIFQEYFPNTPEKIKTGGAALQKVISERGLDIQFEFAAEYFLDEYFVKTLANDQELLTFSDQRILIELSTFSPPLNIKDIISQLTSKGYKPILAHPERYLYYANKIEEYEKFKEMGCSLQINLLSLSDYYGKSQRKFALSLLEADLVDFLGTDLHRQDQVEKLTDFRDKKIYQLLETTLFKNAYL